MSNHFYPISNTKLISKRIFLLNIFKTQNGKEKTYTIAAVLIVILVQIFPRYHTLQYLKNDELQTESFKTTEGFNKRAQELQADSIKYWLYLEK